MARTIRAVPGSYLRHPRTMNERRAIATALEEGVRVRRKERHLPSDWDDQPVAALAEVRGLPVYGGFM